MDLYKFSIEAMMGKFMIIGVVGYWNALADR